MSVATEPLLSSFSLAVVYLGMSLVASRPCVFSLPPDPVRMNRHASTQQSSCRLLLTPQSSWPLAAIAITGTVGIDFDPPTKSQVLLLNRVLGSTLSVGVRGAGIG